MKYYGSGSSAYVDIWDLSEIMVALMKDDVINERFITIADNMTFKTFQEKVANALEVKPAKKEAHSLLLEIGWRLDWLNHKLFGKRRRLSKQMAKSVRTTTMYDNTKIKSELDFAFETLDHSISKVSEYYKKDLKKS